MDPPHIAEAMPEGPPPVTLTLHRHCIEPLQYFSGRDRLRRHNSARMEASVPRDCEVIYRTGLEIYRQVQDNPLHKQAWVEYSVLVLIVFAAVGVG